MTINLDTPSSIVYILVEETGAGLPNGIEHFGYKDGISNPRYLKKDIEERGV